MARCSRKAWRREFAAMVRRPKGEPAPVPKWKLEIDRLREQYRRPPYVPPEPVLKGYLIAAIYENADGEMSARFLTPDACQQFMQDYINEGSEKAKPAGGQAMRVFN